MERTLNLNDSWEQIINDEERLNRIASFHEKRRQKKLEKMIGNAILSGIGSVLLLTMGLTGLLVGWMAYPMCAAFAGFACFMGGAIWHEIKQ